MKPPLPGWSDDWVYGPHSIPIIIKCQVLFIFIHGRDGEAFLDYFLDPVPRPLKREGEESAGGELSPILFRC